MALVESALATSDQNPESEDVIIPGLDPSSPRDRRLSLFLNAIVRSNDPDAFIRAAVEDDEARAALIGGGGAELLGNAA